MTGPVSYKTGLHGTNAQFRYTVSMMCVTTALPGKTLPKQCTRAQSAYKHPEMHMHSNF